MDYKIYEDNPHTDIWMKGILLLPSAIILVTAIMLWQESLQATLCLITGSILFGFIFIFIIPIRYCIFNNKIRIEFRGPFAFNIPFETVIGVREPRWFSAGINLPTNMSQSSALEIARKGRMSVNITPADKQAFISSFHKAFQDWKQGKDI
jgi:hypothetical protein